jgi:hypothetical protein
LIKAQIQRTQTQEKETFTLHDFLKQIQWWCLSLKIGIKQKKIMDFLLYRHDLSVKTFVTWFLCFLVHNWVICNHLKLYVKKTVQTRWPSDPPNENVGYFTLDAYFNPVVENENIECDIFILWLKVYYTSIPWLWNFEMISSWVKLHEVIPKYPPFESNDFTHWIYLSRSDKSLFKLIAS